MNAWLNAILFQGVLKVVNADDDLIFGVLELLLGNLIKFLGLFEVKFKLLALTVPLALLILLPVFDTLLVPFFHETSVALQLVDLDAAHLLLAHRRDLLVLVVEAGSHGGMALLLTIELGDVRLHVQLLLGLV